MKTRIPHIKNAPRADFSTGRICVNSDIYTGQLNFNQNIILTLYLHKLQIAAAYMGFNLVFLKLYIPKYQVLQAMSVITLKDGLKR